MAITETSPTACELVAKMQNRQPLQHTPAHEPVAERTVAQDPDLGMTLDKPGLELACLVGTPIRDDERVRFKSTPDALRCVSTILGGCIDRPASPPIDAPHLPIQPSKK
jgi:hypothetical protein